MDVRSGQPLRCSRCRHYTPEGRRGGYCSLFDVPVQGGWDACKSAVPVFMATIPQTGSPRATTPAHQTRFPEPPLTPEPLPAHPLQVPGPAFVGRR
jgi:hypothetical protein